jgi:predicted metal-dependent peptidase
MNVPADPEVLHRVAAARLWAAHHFPYLASALFASPVEVAPGLGGVAADMAWRVYVDPEVVRTWPIETTASMLVHHVGHLLRDHATRAVEVDVAHDVEGWLRATDAEINDDFAAGLTLPASQLRPVDLDLLDGRLAEEYFTDLRDGRHLRSTTPCQDCGSAAHGAQRPWERGSGPTGGDADAPGGAGDGRGVDGPTADLLRRQVAAEVLAHGRRAGDVPAGLERWATALLRPVVDWRRALRAEIRRGVGDAAGRVDYSYRRPSRRAAAFPQVVLPSLRRPVPEVAVVCDTSGSVAGPLLDRVVAEVDGVLAAVGLRGVRILAVDAAVHDVRRVSRVGGLRLRGGGGTDMGVGIAGAAALRPRPAVVVVLTDGETPWPDAPPVGLRVVVGLIGADAPDAPDWARTVRIVPDL